MSEGKKPAGPRKVWRMSAETPSGAFVDSTPPSTAPTPEPRAGGSAKLLTPARVPSWHASSMDLLHGATARDVTDTIPDELFDALFQRGTPSP